jgi:hypothetical protein
MDIPEASPSTPSREQLTCFRDREWRLDHLYKIVNESGQTVTFKRNDAQRALWSQIHYWNLILKARQRGISTFVAIIMLDACLFNSNTHCGLIDATLTDATKKLDKIRFAFQNLPAELRRIRPLLSDNATSLEWLNGSRIDVGTSHRGGTLQILHVSEMGKIAATAPRRSREIRTGAFGTIHEGSLVFVESTAEGAAGDFFELVQDADALAKQDRKPAPQQFKLIFLPWWKHETYNIDARGVVITKEQAAYFESLRAEGIELTAEQQAWYVIRQYAIGPDHMWREYPSTAAEAFKVSLEGAYFNTQLTKARLDRRIGQVTYDPSRPVHTCWDIGKSDNTAIWFFQAHGQMIHLIYYLEDSGEGVAHYANELKRLSDAHGWTYGRHYGPHDLDASHWVLPGREKIVDVARNLGIHFIVVPRIANKMDSIEAARNWLTMCWIDETNCAQGLRCLDNYTKEWDDRLGRYKSEPLHNWASHGADALQCGACGFQPDFIPPPSDRYAKARPRGSAWAA